jgi:hypothetical protein
MTRHVWMDGWMYVCVCIYLKYMHIYILNICACMYIYVYIYINIYDAGLRILGNSLVRFRFQPAEYGGEAEALVDLCTVESGTSVLDLKLLLCEALSY